MLIPPRKTLFRTNDRTTNPVVVALLIIVILLLLLVLREVDSGGIPAYLTPTQTPTRTVSSYKEEAETYFIAGDLERSIEAYRRAAIANPGDAELLAEMARIQVYSSRLITIDQLRHERRKEALATIDQAVAVDPENSMVRAVRAFALGWLAGSNLTPASERTALLTQAEQEAIYAIQLDNQNTLALAYYAEILVDQQKWVQADQNIKSALEYGEELMDVYRINGYVQESLANYSQAITSYKRAVQINPNLTFLYMSIGANYRTLLQYESALEYFDMAAKINEALGVNDPIPYFSIATTYVQMGQFFSAGLNARKGLNFNPDNADAFGRLGVIYHRARNFEGAITAFKCATQGCTAEESCEVRQCNPDKDPMLPVNGLPLSPGTIDYYMTYGAVLAGMHRQSNGYCAEGMRVLAQVKASEYVNDIILRNVNESEAICRYWGY